MRKFTLTQQNADDLILLMNDLLLSEKLDMDFRQDNCQICVIGGALKRNLLDDGGCRYSINRYDTAVRSLAMPDCVGEEDDEFSNRNMLSGYLFGSSHEVISQSEKLGVPINQHSYNMNQNDAWDRIKTVLEAGGFDVEFDTYAC